jgi:hypothetical protein
MAGASAIYLEQGGDQFFKPGPGDHPFQLNPLGRITDEFVRFAEKHPNRGTPYTPVAFLLDRAHGFEMTDYPHWPFEVSQIDRSDRALRELFGVAYYPGTVVEGEPAIADRQPFVSGVFGDIFDVLTTSEGRPNTNSPLSAYRAVVVGGHVDWSARWAQRLTDYVRDGGTVVLNPEQTKGLSADFIGLRVTGTASESDSAQCILPGTETEELNGQTFRYNKVELQRATAVMRSPSGDPLVTINKVGKGTVIFCALPDLLGEDERVTPFAAHLLAHVFSDASPIRVVGDVEYLLNRSTTGWIITMLNNNGVFKPQQGLAQVDRNAYVTARIDLGSQQSWSAVEWISEEKLTVQNQSVTVKIAPGGVAIVELRP